MTRFLAILAIALFFGGAPANATSVEGKVAVTCGTQAYTSGSREITITKNGALCVLMMKQIAGVAAPVEACGHTAVVAIASSGNNEIVALSGVTQVRVCSWLLVADGAVGIQFIGGHGTACATGETNLTGVIGMAAAGAGFSNPVNEKVFTTIAGDAFCIELSGNVAVNGYVMYEQY